MVFSTVCRKLKREKRRTKYFVALLAAIVLVLPLTASNTTTTAPVEPENTLSSEQRPYSLYGGITKNSQNLLSQYVSKIDSDSKIAIVENYIIEDKFEAEEVLKIIVEEQDPVLIHETYTAVPYGYDKYAVTYHIFNTGIAGPNIVVIGGVHGSERAGQEAAQYLVDNFDFTSGSFLIIPKATATAPNSWGPGGHNLNRQFPGNSDGNAAQRVAALITELLDDFQPCVIIDMHEAYKDGFSNKILYWPGHETTSEKLEAIRFVSDEINRTNLVGRHLGEYGGRNFGPARSKRDPGTTTQEYTLRYNVPAFTTETCMSNRLSVRVEQKVFIIYALFEFYRDKHDNHVHMPEALEVERKSYILNYSFE